MDLDCLLLLLWDTNLSPTFAFQVALQIAISTPFFLKADAHAHTPYTVAYNIIPYHIKQQKSLSFCLKNK